MFQSEVVEMSSQYYSTYELLNIINCDIRILLSVNVNCDYDMFK